MYRLFDFIGLLHGANVKNTYYLIYDQNAFDMLQRLKRRDFTQRNIIRSIK